MIIMTLLFDVHIPSISLINLLYYYSDKIQENKDGVSPIIMKKSNINQI